ncbi:hypothetical protein [Pseudomonas lurida]|uniref:hypothetical protein n=1 Tax=Pseudomonas lurida TaxID=244566 RepID=UPI001646D46F|nr:hypothetical protein [Pseudomonas lurida]MBC3233969.1 hypothetical protein [Pseudomonas lurida]
MTTNQTIDGVSRKLLENCANYTEGSASYEVLLWHKELRALLDAPACKVCNDAKKMHEPGQEPGSCAACFDESVEQPQGEPVADALSTGFYVTETGGGKYAINIGFRSMADMQAADAQLRELLKSR